MEDTITGGISVQRNQAKVEPTEKAATVHVHVYDNGKQPMRMLQPFASCEKPKVQFGVAMDGWLCVEFGDDGKFVEMAIPELVRAFPRGFGSRQEEGGAQ